VAEQFSSETSNVREYRGLDDIDREILRRLADNGRLSYAKLSAAVRLSPNAVAERVRRLADNGVITGVHAAIDPAALGKPLTALIDVRLTPTGTPDQLEQAAAAIDGIQEIAFLTGRFDFQLRAACRDPTDLDRLLRQLRATAEVAETETRLVLRDILRRTLPLQ
jgi:Lrp/AsnC family transcriptional regulator, leucine-responsive regulatory protein